MITEKYIVSGENNGAGGSAVPDAAKPAEGTGGGHPQATAGKRKKAQKDCRIAAVPEITESGDWGPGRGIPLP